MLWSILFRSFCTIVCFEGNTFILTNSDMSCNDIDPQFHLNPLGMYHITLLFFFLLQSFWVATCCSRAFNSHHKNNKSNGALLLKINIWPTFEFVLCIHTNFVYYFKKYYPLHPDYTFAFAHDNNKLDILTISVTVVYHIKLEKKKKRFSFKIHCSVIRISRITNNP